MNWHIRLNPKKNKDMVALFSGNGDLTIGGVELEEIRSLRILGVTFDSKVTFETHLREVVSKAVMSLGVVHRAGNLFDCPRVLKNYYTIYVLSHLEYCASEWMSSAESHLNLLDSVVRSAERLCEGELCSLGHRRKVSTLCLLYAIYHRADRPLQEYLHHFVAARNTRPSAALCELALVFQRCRTHQSSC